MKLNILNDDSIFLKPTPWPKLKKRIDKLLEKHAKSIAKVETQKLRFEAKTQAEQLTSDINYKKIPSNATIRKEYVKCEKWGLSEV